MGNINGSEAIVYYRETQGSSAELGSRDFGHVFVEVVNHSSGHSDYYDFWGDKDKPGRGLMNEKLDDARRELHWQVHIRISNEAADRMLSEIASHRLQSQEYRPSNFQELLGEKNTCVTGTRAVLEAGGIHLGTHLTPAQLWNDLLNILGPAAQPYGESRATLDPEPVSWSLAPPQPQPSGGGEPLISHGADLDHGNNADASQVTEALTGADHDPEEDASSFHAGHDGSGQDGSSYDAGHDGSGLDTSGYDPGHDAGSHDGSGQDGSSYDAGHDGSGLDASGFDPGHDGSGLDASGFDPGHDGSGLDASGFPPGQDASGYDPGHDASSADAGQGSSSYDGANEVWVH